MPFLLHITPIENFESIMKDGKLLTTFEIMERGGNLSGFCDPDCRDQCFSDRLSQCECCVPNLNTVFFTPGYPFIKPGYVTLIFKTKILKDRSDWHASPVSSAGEKYDKSITDYKTLKAKDFFSRNLYENDCPPEIVLYNSVSLDLLHGIKVEDTAKDFIEMYIPEPEILEKGTHYDEVPMFLRNRISEN